jgi:uncharacterized membrane protein YccC
MRRPPLHELAGLARGRWQAATRATASVGVVLVAGVLLGHSQWGAVASVGSFAGFYGSDTPYRYRTRLVALVGCALVAAMFLGSVVSTGAVLTTIAVGVASAVAALFCLGFDVPPPREYLIVLDVLVATGLQPADLGTAGGRAGLVSVGAAVGWVVTMLPAAFRRRAPERDAVAGAFSALSGLVAAIGTAQAPDRRRAAVAAVRRARLAVVQAGLDAQDATLQSALVAEELLEVALHVDAEAVGPLPPGWAVAVLGGQPRTDLELATVPLAHRPAAAAALRQALAAAERARAGQLDIPAAAMPLTLSARERVRGMRSWRAVIAPAAVRLGLAVAGGATLGRGLGLGHSYWVGLTAAAVLLASNLTGALRRSIHRVLGTVVGVGLAYLVLAGRPPSIVVVIAAIACQFTAEIFVVASYGTAAVFLTVLALAVFSLGAPEANIGAAVESRLWDTALGAGVAVAARLLLWPRAAAARLPRLQADTLRSVIAALRTVWGVAINPGRRADLETLALRGTRRAVQTRIVSLRAVQTDSSADAPRAGEIDRLWPITRAIETLAHLALSVPESWPPPERAAREQFLMALNKLASAIEGGEPDETSLDGPALDVPALDVPALAGYPRSSAAAAELALAIDRARQAARVRRLGHVRVDEH